MSEDDAAWVQWRYSRQEWAQFDAWAWDHTQRSAAQLLGLGILVGIGFGLLMSVVTTSSDQRALRILPLNVLWFLMGMGVGLFVGCAQARLTYLRGKALHLARQQGARKVSIDAWGIQQAGATISLASLRKVKLKSANPPMLCFTTHDRVSRISDVQEIWIMVPRGREGEARQLVRRFERETRSLRRNTEARPSASQALADDEDEV
ncbi:MAG: hypothetical protein M3Z04_18545 [Chloroflexota bacterium]|nr:hypothetical protein [Chloroflexota bacterium]